MHRLLRQIKYRAFLLKRETQKISLLLAGLLRRRFGKMITESEIKLLPWRKLPFPVNWAEVTGCSKLYIDIGSGHGEILLHDPYTRKDTAVVGFEIKSRYYRLCAHKIFERPHTFVYKADGYQAALYLFADNSLDQITILFPDPWHKKKHNKRRPITEEWLRIIHSKLKKGGQIIIATDWDDYANHITEQCHAVKGLYGVIFKSYAPQEYDLPETHYYLKWKRLGGRTFHAFILKKQS